MSGDAEYDPTQAQASSADSIDTLLSKAEALAASEDLEGARGAYERVHELATMRGDRLSQAMALRGLGFLAAGDGRDDIAGRNYQRACDLFHELGDPLQEAGTLVAFANLEWNRGQFEEAGLRYANAGALCHQAEEFDAEGDALLSVGDCRKESGRPGAAREAYVQARNAFKACDSLVGQAHACFKTSILYLGVNDEAAVKRLTEAESLYMQADKLEFPDPGLRFENPNLPKTLEDCRLIDSFRMARICRREIERLEPKKFQEGQGDEATAPVAAPKSLSDAAIGLMVLGSVILLVLGVPFFLRTFPALIPSYTEVPQFHLAFFAGALAMLVSHLSGIESIGVRVAVVAVTSLVVFQVSGGLAPRAESVAYSSLSQKPVPQNPRDLASELLRLGKDASSQKIDLAKGAYSEAYAIYEELDDKPGMARSLASQAAAERDLGQNRDARDHFRKARSLFKDLGLSKPETETLLGLADVERKLGHQELAREAYDEVLRIYRDQEDTAGELEVLERIVALERAGGRLAEARSVQLERTALLASSGNLIERRRALLVLGDLERDTGRVVEARQAFSDALATAKRAGDPLAQAEAYLRLGELETSVGQPIRAEESFDAATALYRAGGDRSGEAGVVMRLATLEPDPEERRRRVELAARIFDQAGDPEGKARALLQLGRFEATSSNVEEGRASLQSAIEEFAAERNSAGEAEARLTLGELEHSAQNQVEAGHHYAKAEQLFGAARAYSDQARAALLLADVQRDLDRPGSARQAYSRALAAEQKSGSLLGQAEVYRRIAALVAKTEPDLAAECLAQVEDLERRAGVGGGGTE